MIFSHFRNCWNFGDNVCCPGDYFPEFARCAKVDLAGIPPGVSPVVLGGGGIIFKNNDEWIAKLSKTRPVAIWGAGLNYPLEEVPEGWESYFSDCRLVGLRDVGYVNSVNKENIVFTPCPSCLNLHFAVARNHPPKECAVIYEHCSNPIRKDFPFLLASSNSAGPQTFDSVIDFLASGRTVITNSYHGAYWGLLLGRSVVIYRPARANRFYSGLPLVPVTDDPEVVRHYIKFPVTPDRGYLQMCQRLNYSFLHRLQSLSFYEQNQI